VSTTNTTRKANSHEPADCSGRSSLSNKLKLTGLDSSTFPIKEQHGSNQHETNRPDPGGNISILT
jgi:hypothetical protein